MTSAKIDIYRDLYKQAKAARSAGDQARAIGLFSRCLDVLRNGTGDAVKDLRRSANVHLQLGVAESRTAETERDELRRERHLKRAVQHNVEAVLLAPQSEIASVSLFLSLVDAHAFVDAVHEAVRLLSFKASAEYRKLLGSTWPPEADTEELRVLVQEAKRLLEEHRERSRDEDS